MRVSSLILAVPVKLDPRTKMQRLNMMRGTQQQAHCPTLSTSNGRQEKQRRRARLAIDGAPYQLYITLMKQGVFSYATEQLRSTTTAKQTKAEGRGGDESPPTNSVPARCNEQTTASLRPLFKSLLHLMIIKDAQQQVRRSLVAPRSLLTKQSQLARGRGGQ